MYMCQQLDPILIPDCSVLVSPNNALTSEGERAKGCIQNGITRAGGAAFLLEQTPFAIIEMLKYLSEPSECEGIIKWSYLDSPDINGDSLKEIISIFA